MAAKGAAQGSGLWINGETLTQRAHTETNVRLYLGIASFAILPQRVEHVSDHVADLLKFRYAEAARRACARTHADAACLLRRPGIDGYDILVACNGGTLTRHTGILAGDAQRPARRETRRVG